MPSHTSPFESQGDSTYFSAVAALSRYGFQPYSPERKLRIAVTGAGGFIGSHCARRLKAEGHYIIASDWKRNEHMAVSTLLVVLSHR